MIYVHQPVFIDGKAKSRLTADTEQELLDYSEYIALRPEWIHDAGTPSFHFEVIGTKLRLAVTDPKVRYLTLKEFEELLLQRVSSGE